MMVKSGLEFFILKSYVPLQIYLLTCQVNSAFLGRCFALGKSKKWLFQELKFWSSHRRSSRHFELEKLALIIGEKNWHFKREGAIGFAALLWKSGASLKCSIKTKGRTAVKKFIFSLHNGVKSFFCSIFIFQWMLFFRNIYNKSWYFWNFSQKMSHCISCFCMHSFLYWNQLMNTVFPQIVSAETILFWI